MTPEYRSRRFHALVVLPLLLGLLAGAAQASPTEGSSFGGGLDTTDPITISSRFEPRQVPAGGEVTVTVTIHMEPGWHVNSNTPREDFLIATELLFAESDSFTVAGVTYPAEHIIKFDFSEADVAVYEDGGVVTGRLRLADDLAPGTYRFTGALGYQACNDMTCLAPDEAEFSFTVEVVEGDGVTASTAATGDGEAGNFKSRLTDILTRNFCNPLFALLLTLLAGLLSAATPCVYPLIPITARILMDRGGDNAALGRT
ncbi:MAG: protein-disulfide reductase DsbD domain-containing protein, partial [bacterium]